MDIIAIGLVRRELTENHVIFACNYLGCYLYKKPILLLQKSPTASRRRAFLARIKV